MRRAEENRPGGGGSRSVGGDLGSTVSLHHPHPGEAALAQAALDCGRRGWRMVQLHGLRADGVTCTCRKGALCGRSTAKHPVDSEWTSGATADEMAAQMARRPWAHNFGVVTGTPSGIWVLDVDPDNGGDATLAALVAVHGPLPLTYTVRTGSGGWHLYFELPDFAVGCSVSKLGPGLDVRGEGGQAVDPPSVSAKGAYSVETDAPVAGAPGWLLDKLRPKVRAEGTGTVRTGPVATVPHPYAAKVRDDELARLDDCTRKGWNGEPWDAATFAVAANLLEIDNAPWSGYTVEQAHADLLAHAPRDDGFTATDHEAKWQSARAKVGVAGRPDPGDDGVTFMARTPSAATGETAATQPVYRGPGALSDAHLTDRVARDVLAGRFCWTGALGWLRWDGRRWQHTTEVTVVEAVRLYFIEQHASAARGGADTEVLQALSRLLSRTRILAVVALTRGVVLADAAAFDQHRDLLNVANGVVDLPTGKLLPHDPALLQTRITEVAYDPQAAHADLQAALTSVPEDVRGYLQVRMGQAATGHTPPDDTMPVLQGGGSNGKTAITGAVQRSLGEHAVLVSDRVLLASEGQHPTEMMDLRGARFALIEETPEARRLSVARLKKTVGTPEITARLMRCDDVTFRATHGLFLTTNYRPQVEETDDGTWRRLQLVRFPYRFRLPGEALTVATDRRGDSGLKERLLHGEAQQRAVLRWLVDGAVAWYHADRVMPTAPERVKADTLAWRTEADHVLGFITERLVFDRDRHVMGTDLLADFNAWAESRGLRPWGNQTLAERFGAHSTVTAADVQQRRLSSGQGLSRWSGTLLGSVAPARFRGWAGVRFRTDADDAAEALQASVDGVDGGPRKSPSDPPQGTHGHTPSTPSSDWQDQADAAF